MVSIFQTLTTGVGNGCLCFNIYVDNFSGLRYTSSRLPLRSELLLVVGFIDVFIQNRLSRSCRFYRPLGEFYGSYPSVVRGMSKSFSYTNFWREHYSRQYIYLKSWNRNRAAPFYRPLSWCAGKEGFLSFAIWQSSFLLHILLRVKISDDYFVQRYHCGS